MAYEMENPDYDRMKLALRTSDRLWKHGWRFRDVKRADVKTAKDLTIVDVRVEVWPEGKHPTAQRPVMLGNYQQVRALQYELRTF